MKKSSGDEPGKIFVGGLTRNTTKEMLDAEFCKYGEIIDSIVVKNMETGISRGFGFITYKDPNSVNSCLQKQIKIDGKIVEVKLCNTKLAAQQRQLKQNSDSCKLFIGGLPHNVSDDEIKQFFQRYGPVKEFKMMYDDIKKRPRGFGFITFESEESASQLLMEHYVSFKGKQIEVKPQIHNLKQHTPTNIGGYPANYDFWNLAAVAAIQPNAQAQLAATQGSWSAQANANWGASAGPYNYQSYNGQNPNQNWNYNYYGQAQGYYQTQADNAAIYDNQTTNAQLNNYDNYAITAGIHDPHHAAYYANPNASLLPAPLAAAVPPPPPPPTSGGVSGSSAQQASSQQIQAKSYTSNYQNNQTTNTQRYQQNRNSGFVQSNGTTNASGNISNLNNDSYQSTRQTQVTGYHPYRR